MIESEIIFRILLTIVFGAILGLETETRVIENQGAKKAKSDESSRIGGLRTYTILCLMGGIAGLFFFYKELVFAYMIFAAITFLIIAAYIQNVQLKHAFGLTTEIAILITFFIGFLCTSNFVPLSIILFILIILAFFLSQKRGIGSIIQKVNHQEIIDVLKFGMIALIILPLLPNQSFALKDLINLTSINAQSFSEDILNINVINPFRIWFIVCVISGINLFGYILSKWLGAKKGLILTSLVGGIISSTSTTFALASKSKKEKKSISRILAGGAVLSNAISFVSISILISVLDLNFLNEISYALIGMFLAGVIVAVILFLNAKVDEDDVRINVSYSSFSLEPALKFVLLITVLTIVIQILQITDNSSLIILITALAGITGLDVPTIATTELLLVGSIGLNLAVALFLSANYINFISKSVIGSMNGSKEFRNSLILGLLITAAGSLLVLL